MSEEVTSWFKAIDGNKDGRITSAELQTALVNAQGQRFSIKSCDLMLQLFSTSNSLTEAEFRNLYGYINEWMKVFVKYDKDKSGLIEEEEFASALKSMGYKLSRDFVKVVMDEGKLSADEFIAVCLQMWKLTDHFRRRDKDKDGIVTLGFEDFVSIVLDSCL